MTIAQQGCREVIGRYVSKPHAASKTFSLFLSDAVIVTILLTVPFGLLAEGDSDLSQITSANEKSKAPEPINRTNPEYPRRALNQGQEGWVLLSFTIATDGTVIEPMIEDSTGNEDFERAGLSAVKGWKYSPAMENGVPVEQSMTSVRLVFQMENTEKSARRQFVLKYRKIAKLIEERKLSQVEPLLTDLQYGERKNLYEDAWFWWLRFVYLKAIGSADIYEKESCLRKAIGYEEDYLPPDIFVVATQELYLLEVQKMDLCYAIGSYDRLLNSKVARSSKFYKDAVAGMETHVQKLREMIAGDNVLKLNARINEHNYWVHPLVRRSFSIEEIVGTVNLVDIRCTDHTARYTLSETRTWDLPDDWGGCTLYVKGEPSSTFMFYEYPQNGANNSN